MLERPPLPANEETPVAAVVIYASSHVETHYVDDLDHPLGHQWLRDRLDRAKEVLGTGEARVTPAT